ncbi:MAG: hypothetical protein KGI69_03105, partial [Patescibacteria group bacterium]|nr:hypothetical protein [Patescibacteria group bacterium]
MHRPLATIFAILAFIVGVQAYAPQAHADITTGLVGYWKLDEGSGTTATDTSSTGDNGTINNGATYVTGKIGPYALQVASSSNQYVNVPDNAALNPSAITVSAWVDLTSLPQNGYASL